MIQTYPITIQQFILSKNSVDKRLITISFEYKIMIWHRMVPVLILYCVKKLAHSLKKYFCHSINAGKSLPYY